MSSLACSDHVPTRCPAGFCFVVPIAPVLGVGVTRTDVLGNAALEDVTQSSPDHVPVVSVPQCTSVRCSLHHERALVCSDANCTAAPSPSCVVGACLQHCNHPQCAPRALSRGHNLETTTKSSLRQVVIVQRASSCRMQQWVLHVALFQFLLPIPCVPEGLGGTPVSDGPANPCDRTRCRDIQHRTPLAPGWVSS